MVKHEMILKVWEDYLFRTDKRDIKKYLVKSEVDTNDADYIYGVAVHSSRQIVTICICMAYEFSKSNSKRWNGEKTWEIWRYHHNSEFSINGLNEFIETLTITEIPEESRSWLQEQFLHKFGDVVYDSDFEMLPDDFADYNISHLADEAIQKHGWVFFDQLNKEIYTWIEKEQRQVRDSESRLKAGTLNDKETDRTEEYLARCEKHISIWQNILLELEAFMIYFTKPENDGGQNNDFTGRGELTSNT